MIIESYVCSNCEYTFKYSAHYLTVWKLFRLLAIQNLKVHIAREHLLPKQLQEHGLRKGNLQVRDEALLEIIRYYTREAGVRTLERQIAKVCRKAAKIIVTAERKRIVVTEKNVVDLLGKHIFRYGQAEKQTKLVWRQV